jgi:hypothetical protein
MNTPVNGFVSCPPAPMSSVSGASKLSTWLPNPFRSMSTSSAPSSSCPPRFEPAAERESRMAPAHVPHTGFTRRNAWIGSCKLERRMRSAIVVDSRGIAVRTNKGETWPCKRTSTGDDKGVAASEIVWSADLQRHDALSVDDAQVSEHRLMLSEGAL